MQRLAIVVAIAIGIFAGSDCLTFKDGKIINRCGIWQFVTNSSLVLLVESKSNKYEPVTYEVKRVKDNWKQVQQKINPSGTGTVASINGSTGTIIPTFTTLPISGANWTSTITSASITIQSCSWQGDVCTIGAR